MMKCARLRLQERSKIKSKSDNQTLTDRPRRYCQKRLVNPDHEEDPRWTDVFERFHCNADNGQTKNLDSPRQQDNDDIFLTVQTLQFKGEADQEQVKRPRTSFKYKTTDGNKHRMFVKQPVTNDDYDYGDRSSQLTYYFDDYVKYLFNNDRSRPNSSKSGFCLKGVSANLKENKSIQVDISQRNENKKPPDTDSKVKEVKKSSKNYAKELIDDDQIIENAKITYRKSGKRKSLTISRAQSPETVQVIRVDVVCNYTSSSLSDYEDNRNVETSTNTSEYKMENISLKSHFANKYLLTNTIKTLDENIPGGAKVTLLCKTFKLSDRSKLERPNKDTDKKYTRVFKDVTRNDKIKNRKQLMK